MWSINLSRRAGIFFFKGRFLQVIRKRFWSRELENIPEHPGRLIYYPATYRDIHLEWGRHYQRQAHSTAQQTLPGRTFKNKKNHLSLDLICVRGSPNHVGEIAINKNYIPQVAAQHKHFILSVRLCGVYCNFTEQLTINLFIFCHI